MNNSKVTSGLTTPKDLKAPSPKLTVPALTAPSSFINSQKTITASASTEKYTQAKTLLEAIWRSRTLVHQIGYINRANKQFKNSLVKDIDDAVSNAFANSDAGFESYFAIAEYISPNNRLASNVSGAYGFWADLDVGEDKAATGKGYKTIEEAKAKVMKFCEGAGIPEPTHFVNSGSGFHIYWVTDRFIDRDTWQKFAKMLKALTKSLKCLADDTRTADIASVLRVPGTLNRKYNPPRLVVLTHASDKFISLDTMLAAIESAHERFCEAEVTTVNPSNIEHMYVGTATADMHETLHNVKNIKSALAAIDPDCDREIWFKTSCALRSLDWVCGEELARSWSKGEFWKATNQTTSKYDAREFDIMWKSIRSDAGISIGTLFHYAKVAGWAQFDEFQVCETIIIDPNGKDKVAEAASDSQPETKLQSNSQVKANPLDKHSLLGRSGDLDKLATKQNYILGNLAISGQATVLYAWPNTGKTLFVLYLLIEAIKLGKIDPSMLYYINVDDDLSGLIQKNYYAEEYGFNMLAEGHRNFTASAFLELMTDMTDNNQANGVIIVLDTLKKFANLMDKVNSAKLTRVVRGFIMKGGTVIALAHANKKPDLEGKPIFTGTTDILDDFDCAYRMYPINDDPKLKTVEFENIKRRGDVAGIAAYSYCNESGISYTERLSTVQFVDESQRSALNLAEVIKSDVEVIDVVISCISDGINKKMKLADTVSERSGISKRNAIKVIEKYTGSDAATHKWSFSVGDRGAKIFTVLESISNKIDSESPDPM